MSLKPTAAVFLLKRNHKNLTTEEYAENLIAYLSNGRCCKSITVEDLNVMRGIMSWSIDVPNESQSNNNTKDPQVSVQLEGEKNPIQYQIGEHLIAFWVEGNETKWHLGVIESIENENTLVSYMIRTDTNGKYWTYPESAEVLLNSCDQVLASKVKVQYLGSVRIRCNILSNNLIQEMNTAVKNDIQ